jgi:TetR/AcrR family transcriptional repressor of lmrAB and yxaGH operons
MTSDSRANMIRSAASLIGSRGISATSFSDVLADSGAPRGSIYHHFPDGKRQLAIEAMEWTSQQILGHLLACPAATAADVLGCFIDLWRQSVVQSCGTSGCPVAGVAIDTGTGEDGLIDVVRETFRSWTTLLAERLEGAGVPAGRAASIAVTTLASMEGALILCRAEGGTGPLEAAAGELMRLLPT